MLLVARVVEQPGDKIAVKRNGAVTDRARAPNAIPRRGKAVRAAHDDHTLVGRIHRTENPGGKIVALCKRRVAQRTAHKNRIAALVFLRAQVVRPRRRVLPEARKKPQRKHDNHDTDGGKNNRPKITHADSIPQTAAYRRVL